jgi:glycosyltransferase involved in cell wall biosynthesis
MADIEHDLVVVGCPGRGEETVRRALAALPDPHRVIRLSGLRAPVLAKLYRGADLFVFPSTYEGFGLPVLEAMMAQVPVITTTKGSIPEVGGDCAVYAEPPDPSNIADRIRTVLAWRPEQRTAWVARGEARAAKFSWEASAKKTMAVLKDACHTPQSRWLKARRKRGHC